MRAKAHLPKFSALQMRLPSALNVTRRFMVATSLQVGTYGSGLLKRAQFANATFVRKPQCDMDVHVGGKRTHERYLLMGQRVELPISQGEGVLVKYPSKEMGAAQADRHQDQERPSNNCLEENRNASTIAMAIGNTISQAIDLNSKPAPSYSGKGEELANGKVAPSSNVPDVDMRKDDEE